MEELKPYAGKRITEKRIREILNKQDYQEHYKVMQHLLQKNLIEPVLSSGSNGMNPPLYKRYRVQKDEKCYDDILPEIRLLHTSLNVEGYLNQPEKYEEHKEWLILLNSWLKENLELLNTPVSSMKDPFRYFNRKRHFGRTKILQLFSISIPLFGIF